MYRTHGGSSGMCHLVAALGCVVKWWQLAGYVVKRWQLDGLYKVVADGTGGHD